MFRKWRLGRKLRVKLAGPGFQFSRLAQRTREPALDALGEFDAHDELILTHLFPLDADQSQRRRDAPAREFKRRDQWRDTYLPPADLYRHDAEHELRQRVNRRAGGAQAAAAGVTVPILPQRRRAVVNR